MSLTSIYVSYFNICLLLQYMSLTSIYVSYHYYLSLYYVIAWYNPLIVNTEMGSHVCAHLYV